MREYHKPPQDITVTYLAYDKKLFKPASKIVNEATQSGAWRSQTIYFIFGQSSPQ